MMTKGRFCNFLPFFKNKQMKQLPTGVKTTEKKIDGIIRIEVDDRSTFYGKDEYFEQPTLESELANNTALLLNDVFKHFNL